MWLQGTGERQNRGCRDWESHMTMAVGDGSAQGCGGRGQASFGGRAGPELPEPLAGTAKGTVLLTLTAA